MCVSVCVNLNEIGPHMLIWSFTIRRCDFGAVDLALLEEMLHYGGWALTFPMLKMPPSVRVHFS